MRDGAICFPTRDPFRAAAAAASLHYGGTVTVSLYVCDNVILRPIEPPSVGLLSIEQANCKLDPLFGARSAVVAWPADVVYSTFHQSTWSSIRTSMGTCSVPSKSFGLFLALAFRNSPERRQLASCRPVRYIYIVVRHTKACDHTPYSIIALRSRPCMVRLPFSLSP